MAKSKEEAVSVFSMEYHAELPKLLRLIADQLETGTSTASSFTCGHSEGQFDLRITLDTEGNHG